MPDVVFGFKCPECGQGTVRDTRVPTYSTMIRGCPFVVRDALIGVCDSCGSKHFIDTETKKWAEAFERSQSSLYLSPSEIRGVRKALALTTDQFSFLIGCSRQSLYNWESETRSAPPSRTVDLIVRMLKKRLDGPIDVLQFVEEEALRFGRDIVVRPKRPALVYDAQRSFEATEVRESRLGYGADTSAARQVTRLVQNGEEVGVLFYDYQTASIVMELDSPLPGDSFMAQVVFQDGQHVLSAVRSDGTKAALVSNTSRRDYEVARIELVPRASS